MDDRESLARMSEGFCPTCPTPHRLDQDGRCRRTYTNHRLATGRVETTTDQEIADGRP